MDKELEVRMYVRIYSEALYIIHLCVLFIEVKSSEAYVRMYIFQV